MTEPKQWIDDLAKFADTTKETPCLSVEQMKEDILWYVQHYDWVTIVELCRRYGDQSEGDHSLSLEPKLKIILWINMSEKLVTSIIELIHSREIHIHPGSFLAYMIDGGSLRLPLAKKPPGSGYKNAHWLPITFRSGPFCGLKQCPGRIKPVMVKQ